MEAYPGGLPKYLFDLLERRAESATGEPEVIEAMDRDNPRNPALLGLDQTWMFLVRGAGGYAGGLWHYPGKREHIGWGICGDSVLWAWLGEAGLDGNQAHEVSCVDDTSGRHEWEEGWDQNRIDFTLDSRLKAGTADAQTGSFIHESFHAIFNAVHVSRKDLADRGRENEWWEDPVLNIMGGSHLDWPNTAIQQVTLDEMDDTGYYL